MNRRAIVSVAALGLALFVGCSGEHGDTLDKGHDMPSTGDGGAKGDKSDASVSGSDAGTSADASALDAALPDANVSGDAGPPTLMASKATLTVPRCGSDSFDVTWSASASLPEVTVEGLPEGVSYHVTSAEGAHASVTVSASTQAAATAPVDVTVRALDVTTVLKLGIPVAFAPKVRVFGSNAAPIENAVVVLNSARAAPFMTDASGAATLSEVTPPYDVFVLPQGPTSEAIEYQGLSRCDPAFVGVGTALHEAATFNGVFTAPGGQSFDSGGNYYFGSGSLDQGAIGPVSGTTTSSFGFAATWPGTGTFNDSVSAVWVEPGPTYVGVGSAPVTAMFGDSVNNIAIDFGTALPTRAHKLAVSYGPFTAGSVAAGLLAFDVPGGHRIAALPAGSASIDMGAFVDNAVAGITTLSTTIPTGNTLFAVRAGDEGTVSALKVLPASPDAISDVTFSATGSMQTLNWSGDVATTAVTFSWDAVPGASAIILRFAGSVRAVLPGTATQYTTDNVIALGTPLDDSTCNGKLWFVSAVVLDGYGPDVDADGSARYMPIRLSDFADGAGRLFGAQQASVYTYTRDACH